MSDRRNDRGSTTDHPARGPGTEATTDHPARGPGTEATTGRGLGVVLAIASAERRRNRHRAASTRRKRALLVLGGVALLPVAAVVLILAHVAGDAVADGDLGALAHVARWWLPLVVAMTALNAAVTVADAMVEFGARELHLATVPDRTLALGVLAGVVRGAGLVFGLPVAAVYVAFALGAGSTVTVVVGTAAALLVVAAGGFVGMAVGLAGRLALLRVPLSTDARELYGTVAKAALMIGFGAGGAVAGATLGDIEDSKLRLSLLAPSGPAPAPGHAADWLFVGTPLVDGPGTAAVASGAGLLALTVLSAAAVVDLAPRVWYADPAKPPSDDEGTDRTHAGAGTVQADAARPASFLDGGRVPALGRTGVVLDGLLRRTARRPSRLAYVAYYAFLPVVMGVSALSVGVAPATVAGGALVILGLWLAGGVFCLNPLGEEGTMLGQVVLGEIEPRTHVRARLLAGTALGAPLVLAGAGLLAVEAFAPRRAAVLGAYWLALVPASAGLALGLGTLLPNTETRAVLDAVEVRAPATLAIGYHGLLVYVLADAGRRLTAASLDPLVAGGAAVTLGGVLVVAGHGGYRFAVSGLADHGRPRRADPVYALELGAGLALAGLALSTSAGLGAIILVDADGLGGFVAGFLGQYVGWATVAVAYPFVSGRTDYLDLAWPTRADLRTGVAGVAALLGVWALVTAGVSLLDLPLARHSLGGSVDGGVAVVATLVVLSVLVVGPVEELLFRNVVQKRLAEALDRRRAVAAASALFALVHLPVYATGGPLGAATSLAMLAVLGGILGVVYERTGTVVVPALCHGVYNAALFVLVFVVA